MINHFLKYSEFYILVHFFLFGENAIPTGC